MIPHGIPAIVDEELFEIVQEMLQVNHRSIARHKAKKEYLLTTKLYCGKCKSQMFGESGKNSQGKVYRYYKCAGVKQHSGCDKKTVKKEPLEDLVIGNLMKIVFDDDMINYIADREMEILGKEDPLLPLLRDRLEETKTGIANLIHAMEQGILTESTKARLEELEQQKARLQAETAALEAKKPAISRQMIVDFICSFRSCNPKRLDHRRRLINCFVNKIVLFDDKIIITYNFKNKRTTITFKEIDAAAARSESLLQAAPEDHNSNILQIGRTFGLCFFLPDG